MTTEKCPHCRSARRRMLRLHATHDPGVWWAVQCLRCLLTGRARETAAKARTCASASGGRRT